MYINSISVVEVSVIIIKIIKSCINVIFQLVSILKTMVSNNTNEYNETKFNLNSVQQFFRYNHLITNSDILIAFIVNEAQFHYSSRTILIVIYTRYTRNCIFIELRVLVNISAALICGNFHSTIYVIQIHLSEKCN